MSQYLVRWKFAANTLLNHSDTETFWYQQIHTNKKKAVDHYASLLHNTSPSMGMTTEIFQLVPLIPGQPEPEDIPENDATPTRLQYNNPKKRTPGRKIGATTKDRAARDLRIRKSYSQGASPETIALAEELSPAYVRQLLRKWKLLKKK